MSWSLVRLDDTTPSPWKNGGGRTRELLAWPAPGEWQLRVSVADVEGDGPFSSFAGIQRWFAVLEGAGVRLSVDGRVAQLRRDSQPFEFDGGAATTCALLDGATRDFNLMARGRRASMRRQTGSSTLGVAAGAWVGVYAHENEVSVNDGGQRLRVPARCLAWRVMGGTPVDVSISGPDFLLLESMQ